MYVYASAQEHTLCTLTQIHFLVSAIIDADWHMLIFLEGRQKGLKSLDNSKQLFWPRSFPLLEFLHILCLHSKSLGSQQMPATAYLVVFSAP